MARRVRVLRARELVSALAPPLSNRKRREGALEQIQNRRLTLRLGYVGVGVGVGVGSTLRGVEIRRGKSRRARGRGSR